MPDDAPKKRRDEGFSASEENVDKYTKETADSMKESSVALSAINKELASTNKDLLKVTKGRERVEALASIHFKAINTSIRGLVEDYKSNSKAMGLKADTNAIAMASDMKQIVKSAQDGSRLAVQEAAGQLEGFANAIEFAGEREKVFLKKALAETQRAVREIEEEMPSMMGEIVNETIKIPLDALDSFMESNYFTRIIKGAFLAHRARKKAAIKEEKLRLEQLKAEETAQLHQEAQIKDFYSGLSREIVLMIKPTLREGTEGLSKDADYVNPETGEKFQGAGVKADAELKAMESGERGEEGQAEAARIRKSATKTTHSEFQYEADETARATLDKVNVDRIADQKRATGTAEQPGGFSDLELGRAQTKIEETAGGIVETDREGKHAIPDAATLGVRPHELSPRQAAQETAQGIGTASPELLAELKNLISVGKSGTTELAGLLYKILTHGLGAASPGWLSTLVDKSAEQLGITKESVAVFKDGVKEQATSIKEGAKEQATTFATGFKEQATIIGGSLQEEVAMFTDGIKEQFAPFIETFTKVKEKATAIVGGVKGMFKKKEGPVPGAGEDAGDGTALPEPSPKISGGITKIFESLKGGMAGLGKGIAEAIKGIFTAVAEGFKKLADPEVLKGAIVVVLIAAGLALLAGAFFLFGLTNWGGVLIGLAVTGLLVGALLLLGTAFMGPQLAALMLGMDIMFLLGIAMIPLAVAMILMGVAVKIFAGGLKELASIPFTQLLGIGLFAVMLSAIAPLLAVSAIFLLIAAPAYAIFGLALSLLALGIQQFANIGWGQIFAMWGSLVLLSILAIPLGLAAPFMVDAAIGFGVFGIALMALGTGIQQFVGVISAIAPMVLGLTALALISPLLAVGGILLLIASVGYLTFGIALMALGFGIQQFVGAIPAILPMVLGLTALALLSYPLALAGPQLTAASAGFIFFSLALITLAHGIKQFVGVMPAILPMVISLAALALLALPLALASPFLILASIGFGIFGFALQSLATGIQSFADIGWGTIFTSLASLYLLVGLAVPLALASPFLLVAAIGFGVFGFALQSLGAGIQTFAGAIWLIPAMIISLYALTALAVPLALASPFLLVAAIGFGIFGMALSSLGEGIQAFVGAIWLIPAMVISLYLLTALAIPLALASPFLLIAALGFGIFGLALSALGAGIAAFTGAIFLIPAMIISLYALTALAIPLALASPFLLVAAIGFGVFGLALMSLAMGVASFVGVMPAILPMVVGLYSLAALAIPLAIASPFLLIASIGFGVFGLALMSLAMGVASFVGVMPAILPMTVALIALAAIAIPLGIAGPFLLLASIGFGAFGIALVLLAFGVSQFVGVMPAILPMVVALAALAAIAIPLGLASPFLLLASIGFGIFGLALIALGLGVSMFEGVMPAILPMVVSLLALAALAIPLAMMSPFLIIAAAGIAIFGLALIPLAYAISLIDLSAAAGFALAMLTITAVAFPLAILAGTGMMALAAVGLVQIAFGVLALGLAAMVLGANGEVLSVIISQLTLLALLSPLLILAAVGIFLISGAMIAFGASMVVANAALGMGAAVGLLGSLFGAENPLDMLFALASQSSELMIAGKGILFMAMGIGMLAKSLQELDAEALTEIGAAMQGILPAEVGGNMNFVAGNLVMGQAQPEGAKEMAADNEQNAGLQMAMQHQATNTVIVGGGGGGGESEKPAGGRQTKGTDGQEGGGRMNESTFRRIQERFYKSAIV